MTIRGDKLHEELRALSTSVEICGCAEESEERPSAINATWHPKGDFLVRVDWVDLPDAQDIALAQGVIDNHDKDTLLPGEILRDDALQARTDFLNLPNWATYSPSEAQDAVLNSILGGASLETVEAQIDASANTVAATKELIKLLAAAVIQQRTIMQKMALMHVYERRFLIERAVGGETPID